MSEFPTVGLKVDLSGIDQGDKAYEKLEKRIDAVGAAAERAEKRVSAAAGKTKASTAAAGKSSTDAAKAEAKAQAEATRAAEKAAREQERNRKYLQQVRIRSIQMEEAARRAAEAEQARAAAKALQDAQRVAKEQERLAKQAARAEEMAAKAGQRGKERAAAEALKAQEKAAREAEMLAKRAARAEEVAARQRAAAVEKAEREATRAREREVRAREMAERKSASEAEKNARYLERVRINSARMEEQAARRAAAEQQRAAREAEKAARKVQSDQEFMRASWAKMYAPGGSGRGGGGAGGGGAGSSGSPFGRGDLALVNAFEGALLKLRHGLTETRRLFLDVRTAIGVFLAGMVVSPVLKMADAMTALRARAGAFTENASDVPYLMEAIYQSAQRSRSPLESIATLYTRLAPLAKQLGKSQMDLLRISETVSKGFQIGGATPEEAKSSAQQLAQALASNRLGGDELRSLAENAPILVQQIAKALDMNTGQFIKWAHSGKANAAVIIGALEKASAEIDRLFGKFPVTIGQSVTLVTNSLQYLVGRVNEMTGASQGLAGFIAQFATLMESEKTIRAVATAVEILGKALNMLGAAFQVLAAAWPVIAAILAGMAVSRLMAVVKGWEALQKAMLAYAAASAIAGRATATLTVAQTAAAAAAATLKAAVMSLWTALGGGLGVALIAVAGAYAYYRANAMDAQEATRRFEDANQTASAAIQRAMAFMEVYGGDTKEMTAYLLELNGVQEDQVRGLDEAGRAAVARAANERTLAAALMERAAAESTSAAAAMRRSVVFDRISAGYYDFRAKVTPTYGGNAEQVAKRNEALRQRDEATARGDFKEALADRLEKQAKVLPEMAAKLLQAPINVTKPTVAGPPAPASAATASNAGRNPWEGAMDRIAKMRAEIEGLKREIETISANPLDELAARIRAAGDEAAASMEAGDKQRQDLADQARAAATEKERLTIIRDMIKESAVNTQNLQREAASYSTLASAQQLSTDIMASFWSNGGGSYQAYAQALQQSRDVMTEALVAESKLDIARRYGVDSIDQIAAALVRSTGVTQEYANRVQDQAKVEAAAAEAAIRRKAVMDAIASSDQDFAGYNEKTFEGLERALDHMTTLSDTLGDSLASAFGRGGRAAQAMLRVISGQRQRELAGARQIAEAVAKYGKDSIEAKKEENRVSTENEIARVEGYAQMATAAKGYFKEGSTGYKVMTALEIALHTLTTLNTLKAMALDGAHTATSVSNSGVRAAADGAAAYAKTLASLPFPFNLAAGAAVLAALAAVGVAITGGGGGSAPRSRMDERQKAQGAGTVLGDAAAKSESIARSLEIVAANSNSDLEFSNDMLVALRSIDANISSLTAALARQLNVGGALSTDGLGLGTTRGLDTGGVLLGTGGLGLALSKVPVIGGIIRSLFGKKTTTTLQDQGISFGSGSLSSILSGGITGNTYQDLAIQTKKKFFGITTSNKTRYETRTAELDQGIRDEVTRVIGSLREGVLAAASILGADSARALLDAMTVSIGDISLKDMTGDEIEAALQAVFSKVGDQMASTAIPAVLELQKAGEGAFETLARVARDYQVLDTSLSSIGLTFGAVGVSSLKARERLVSLAGGIDSLAGSIEQYSQDFLTDAERMGPIIKAVYTELGKLGYGSITTKDQFKQLVNSLDLTTETGAATFATLMRIAPAFAKIVDYTDELKTSNDNVSKAQSGLNDAYDTAVDLISETRDKFLDFVDAFKAFRQELETGSLAANSPQDQYLKTKALFESTSAAALSGDTTALANLQSVSEAYLNASRDYYASTEPYFRDLERVKDAIEAAQAYSQTQVDKADAQLAALNQLVAGWVTVNSSVMTVEQAVRAVEDELVKLVIATSQQAQAIQDALAQAQAAQQAAQQQAANQNIPPPANQNTPPAAQWTAEGYLAANPDIAAAAANLLSTADPNSPWYAAHGLDQGAAGFAAWHWQNQGQYEPGRRYAMGAAFEYGDPINTPTRFDDDWLGEGGSPEAIMPLARTAGGEMGVRVADNGRDDGRMISAIETLTNEVRVSNVLMKAGHTGTLEKLGEVTEGLSEVKSQIRASAA